MQALSLEIPSRGPRARRRRTGYVRTTLAFVYALALIGVIAATARAGDLAHGLATFTLDNGLEIVAVADHRAPVVTHMIWYKAGSADDPPGKSGLAHFLEHLLFMGTPRHPEGEFSRVVAELGGEDNAFTGQDYTAYYQRIAREHLPLMMAYEADRMANLTLSEAQVDTERQVVLEERLSEVETDPAALLSEAVDALLFMSHPYRRPVLGWRHEIEGLSRADALSFYDRYYTPNNAVLVVAGDVTAEEVRRLAEATYGQVERRAEPGPRLRPREPEPQAARAATLTSPLVDQDSLERHWVVPSYTTAERGEAAALELLAELLGSAGTGRLERRLVVDEQLAVSVDAWYAGTALDEARFSLSAEPRDGVGLEELARGFDRVLAELVEAGIPEVELERAKRSLIAQAIYARDSQETLAQIYGAALATGATAAHVMGWVDAIRQVSEGDVAAAAERFLTPQRAATGFLRRAE